MELHTGEFGDIDVIDAADSISLSMEDRCQETQIITHDDLVWCENACKPWLCCYYDDIQCDSPSNPINCKEKQFCQHILANLFSLGTTDMNVEKNDPIVGAPAKEEGGSLETFGSEIEEACEHSNVATTAGREDCTSLCAAYMCCFDKRSSGCSTNRECPRFAPCQVLGEKSQFDYQNNDIKVMEISETCDVSNIDSPGGRVDCQTICDPFMCCFDYSSTGCVQYQKCSDVGKCENLLLNPKENSAVHDFNDADNPGSVSVTATNVEDACSFERVAIQGDGSRCQELCSTFLCCFDFTTAGCAQSPNCRKYQTCLVLMDVGDGSDNGDNGGLSTAEGIKLEVDEACAPASVINRQGERACESLCAPHRCCFNGGCPLEIDTCVRYDACSIIYTSGDERATPLVEDGEFLSEITIPGDLDQVCNPVTIDEGDNQFNCEQSCKMGLCCKQKDNDCQSYFDFCEKFAACAVVWTDPAATQLNEEATQTTSQQEAQKAAPADPQQGENQVSTLRDPNDPNIVCQPKSLATDEGRVSCDKVCEPYKCCWGDQTKKEENCFDQDISTCLKYLICPQS